MKPSEVFLKSLEIRDNLKNKSDFSENPIDQGLLPVLPYKITDKIKLVIIGQDPTVKNPRSRQKIDYTLNLDKNGALKVYIKRICELLEIDFENIYATNLIKYFYTIPPQRTKHVLKSHLPKNLELLKEELVAFPNIPIVSLGLPILQLLTDETSQVKHYWDYDNKTKQTNGDFRVCEKKENILGRSFFPLPHQPSISKVFYDTNLKSYLEFMRHTGNVKSLMKHYKIIGTLTE
jgi:uracil-DNA glycosylase